jgi:hypothetical protein
MQAGDIVLCRRPGRLPPLVAPERMRWPVRLMRVADIGVCLARRRQRRGVVLRPVSVLPRAVRLARQMPVAGIGACLARLMRAAGIEACPARRRRQRRVVGLRALVRPRVAHPARLTQAAGIVRFRRLRSQEVRRIELRRWFLRG